MRRRVGTAQASRCCSAGPAAAPQPFHTTLPTTLSTAPPRCPPELAHELACALVAGRRRGRISRVLCSAELKRPRLRRGAALAAAGGPVHQQLATERQAFEVQWRAAACEGGGGVQGCRRGIAAAALAQA